VKLTKKTKNIFLDMLLIPYRYSSCCCCSSSFCYGNHFKNSLKLRRFKSGWDEIQQDCSSIRFWYDVILSINQSINKTTYSKWPVVNN